MKVGTLYRRRKRRRVGAKLRHPDSVRKHKRKTGRTGQIQHKRLKGLNHEQRRKI